MGRQDMETCLLLADSLAGILRDSPGTIIIASTDLSHYHNDKAARVLDYKFVEHVRNFDHTEPGPGPFGGAV